MKHVRSITRGAPAPADLWQEVVCSIFVGVNLLLGLMGGSSPFGLFIEDKCNIPVPNDSSGDTTT